MDHRPSARPSARPPARTAVLLREGIKPSIAVCAVVRRSGCVNSALVMGTRCPLVAHGGASAACTVQTLSSHDAPRGA